MNRKITINDIIPIEEYSKTRNKRRSEINLVKKNRRIYVGPFITFYFENFHTMLYQIQEMLFIEKGDSNQAHEEIEAYNSLVPLDNELIATVMIEIDNESKRYLELRKLSGIENSINISSNSEKFISEALSDEERTKPDGKTSAIHFIKFKTNDAFFKNMEDRSQDIIISINHPEYNHSTNISYETRLSLIKN
ncbi:DUF3501 family protein [Alphaproteobacteria bacterium]|nr:DUF3501 family protein [Alphaproteobacteria bacterium]